MAVPTGPPILLLLSLITLCLQSCLEAAAPYPPQFHSSFRVSLRLAADSGSSGHEVGSRLAFDSRRKGSSVESKLYSSFPYSALAALKMEKAGSASFQSAQNCLYRVRARMWAASATAPVDFFDSKAFGASPTWLHWLCLVFILIIVGLVRDHY